MGSRITATIIGAAVLVGGYAVVQGGGGSNANLWVDTNGGTCTRQASPAAYSDAAACSSFTAAYQAATLGDTVYVKAGSYSAQTILTQAGKESAGDAADVTIAEAPGETVDVAGINFGQDLVTGNGPDHITVSGFTISGSAPSEAPQNTQGRIAAWVDTNDVTWQNIDAGSFDIHGAKNVTISGGDYGPCDAYWTQGSPGVQGASPCRNNKMDAYGAADSGAHHNQNITIDGATIHGYKFDDSCFTTANGGTTTVGTPDCHYECFFLNSVDTLTIRNTVFYDCALMDIYFTSEGSEAGQGFDDVLVENGWYGQPIGYGAGSGNFNTPSYGRNEGFVFGKCQGGYVNVKVRFNSFAGGTGVGDVDGTSCSPATSVVIAGNVAAKQGCVTDPTTTYAYNVWYGPNSGTCGGTDTNTGSSTMPYASDADGSGMDLALGAGTLTPDNFVPSSVTGGCPSVDKDGTSRPQATNCDAGADER